MVSYGCESKIKEYQPDDKTILIVDQDRQAVDAVRTYFSREYVRVMAATTIEGALELAMRDTPDLMLHDPRGTDRWKLFKQRGQPTENTHLIIVSEMNDTDEVRYFQDGANDCVRKPFSASVLRARVRSVFRQRSNVLSCRGIVLDPMKHQVYAEAVPVQLSLTSFRLLECLLGRPGAVFTRNQLLGLMNKEDLFDRSIDAHIRLLRRSLGTYADRIETVPGVGYRFKDGQD